ncbi:MAG: hypothetical protein AABY22_30080 [Nanoarchaeota archaeon]
MTSNNNNNSNTNLLGTAIKIASEVHEKQFDQGGNAYLLHPIRIMQRLRTTDWELMAIAIMHDVVEDSGGLWTIDKLRDLGFSDRVLCALSLLTHVKEDSYEDYIKKISTNVDSIRVKLEDLKDNSDITRLKGVRQKDFERIVKYNKAYMFLSNVYKNHQLVGYCNS